MLEVFGIPLVTFRVAPSPEEIDRMQSKSLEYLESKYPGLLEGNLNVINTILRNSEDLEVFASLPISYKYTRKVLRAAAELCVTTVLEFILDYLPRNRGDYLEAAIGAAKGGHLDIVDFVVTNYKVDDFDDFDEIAVAAAEGGHLNIVRWAMNKGADNLNEIAAVALEAGHIDIVQWAVNKGVDDFNLMAYSAAKSGKLNMVIWALYEGADILPVIEGASIGGHLDILEWTLDEDIDLVPVTEGPTPQVHIQRPNTTDNTDIFNLVAISGAQGGHLNIVKWAIEKGANDFKSIALTAKLEHRHNIVEWLVNTELIPPTPR